MSVPPAAARNTHLSTEALENMYRRRSVTDLIAMKSRFLRQVQRFALCLLAVLSGCDNAPTSATPAAPTAQPGQSPVPEIERLRGAANAGDVAAQLELAKRYDEGNGVPKDPARAFALTQAAANAGDLAAMEALSDRYADGQGVTASAEDATAWMKKAADAGWANAQYRYTTKFGFVYRGTVFLLGQSKDAEQANADHWVRYLTLAVDQGHPEAQYDLGMLYLLGINGGLEQTKKHAVLKPDPDKAVVRLRASAESGYWEAQWALAVLYQAGYRTVRADAAASQAWWDALSAQTDPAVQYAIGYRYAEENEKEYRSGKNKWQGRALTFEATNQVAKTWFEKASAGGDADAAFALAFLYREGRGVVKDERKFAELLQTAADREHIAATLALGICYYEGLGVTKDYSRAHALISKVANLTESVPQVASARTLLGAMYEEGVGVQKDLIKAYAWYNIALPDGDKDVKEAIARVEKALTSADISKAQQLSRNWTPGSEMGVDGTVKASLGSGAQPAASGLQAAKSGTGFVVSKSGTLITNLHVVEGCTEVRVPAESNNVAKVIVSDKTNDLAVLQLPAWTKATATVSDRGSVAQGEEIVVFGYPLDGFLPNSGNITLGIVSALAGPQNNASLVQITAPVQPGNSGGPLLNKKGQVVGVVVGKANAITIAQVTGDIPQNINYAVSGLTLKAFLDGNHVDYETRPSYLSFSKTAAEIAEGARQYSVKLECWQ